MMQMLREVYRTFAVVVMILDSLVADCRHGGVDFIRDQIFHLGRVCLGGDSGGDAAGDSIRVQTNHVRFFVTHLRRLFNGDSIFANGSVFGFDSRAREAPLKVKLSRRSIT
jgi:hypothetical protein